MKFIISSDYFLKKLTAIEGAIGGNASSPILSNFLLELNNSQLKVTASDTENTMVAHLEVQGEGIAKIAVSATLLLQTIRTFPSQPLTFFLENESNLQIIASQGEYDMPYFDGEEYPPEITIEEAITTVIDPGVFSRGISKTIFATGNPEFSMLMSGVFMEYNEEKFSCSATDSHKLVRYTRKDVTSSGKEIAFVIPKKTLSLLKGILQTDSEQEMTIEYNKKNARFIIDDINLTCKLIVGDYPNFDNVIPKENPNILTVDRKLFLNAVKRISIFSNETNHSMRLSITGQQMSMVAEDFDYSKKGSETMPCDYQGEDMEIGFNAKFLAEMLSNLETEHVSIEMSLSNRPGVLLPISENDNESIVMLVMPIVLS